MGGKWLSRFDSPGMKTCRYSEHKGENPISLENFGFEKRQKDGRRTWCKSCVSIYHKRHDKTPERELYNKNKRLKWKFNISYDDYLGMLEAQHYVCAICGEPEARIDYRTGKPYQLSVDHNEKTGEIRQLLCGRCNLLVGQAGENVDLLRMVISYIEVHNHTED